MLNETGTAFLVDSMGHAPEKLSETEYQIVRDVLEIARDESIQPAAEIMNWTIESVKRRLGSDALLLSIIWHYVNYDAQDRCPHDEVAGVLAGHFKAHSVHWITEEERKTLEQTLTAIRSDFWFAEWISLQVDAMAKSELPEDRYPSPLKIAASLVNCITEHEEKMEAAREMVRMHPNLLATPAAAEQTTQPTKQPAKPRSARKRKKVASAS